MNSSQLDYRGHRFPPQIISHAVWLYHRFTLSFRDVEDVLAERGVIVSYESIRKWCRKFGLGYARSLIRKQGRLGDNWFLVELFITIQVIPTSAVISYRPRRSTESVPLRSSSRTSCEPSDTSRPGVRQLAPGNVCLLR